MSLLQKVLSAHRCTGTHHKLILEALRHLAVEGAGAEQWRKLFLKHADMLLQGASAPDSTFKDFRNHVLHVREKFWGGAIESAETWYAHTVESLKTKQWSKAAYAAGVLSHYYADPLMPLNTARTEEAGIVHRACERSVFKSYDHLIAILERDLGGWPSVKTPTGSRWLGEMIKTGARLAHGHYDVLIDHYNLAKGWRNPAAGLDDEIRVSLAECLGHAVVGMARILDRAIAESEATAPRVWMPLAGTRAWCRIPAMRWTRSRANARGRRIVKAMFKEFKKTGKVIRALPEEQETIRRLHAQEVLKTTVETLDAIKPRPVGTKHGTGTYLRPMEASRGAAGSQIHPETGIPADLPATGISGGANDLSARKKDKHDGAEQTSETRLAKPVPRLAKFHLDPSSSLSDAPSIGNRTAEKLAAIGIRTVADLLARNPEEIAQRLKLGHIKPDTVRDWQVQARLVCRVPNMRTLDAKILIACGITEPEALSKCEALDLLDQVDLFISTSEGQRAIRGGSQPDLDIVTGWITSAGHARNLRAA